MSLAEELHRLDETAEYEVLKATAEEVIARDYYLEIGAEEDPVATNELSFLYTIRDLLEQKMPQHVPEEQKREFNRGLHLFAQYVCEVAIQPENEGLLQYLYAADDPMITMASAEPVVDVLYEASAEEDQSMEIIANTLTEFPVLATMTGELSHHAEDDYSEEQVAGYNQGLYHYATALGVIALHLQTGEDRPNDHDDIDMPDIPDYPPDL